VKSIIGSVTTYYPGAHYEKRVAGQTERIFKYYFAGSTRIAKHPLGDCDSRKRYLNVTQLAGFQNLPVVFCILF